MYNTKGEIFYSDIKTINTGNLADFDLLVGGFPSDTPKHGDKKDGMIYINGFGWVVDEGGGGIGYTDNEMYQNGNKIGYFG